MLRLRHYWQHRTAGKVVIIVVIAFLLVLIGGYSQSRYFAWVGVGDYVSPIGEYQRGKTLWDWLELAIIPVVLAGGAFLLNRASRQSELEIAEVRRQNELEIAQDRDEERALQGYLDAMTELLLDRDLRASEPDSEVRSIARSRTPTVLRNLNGRHKGSAVHFLHQAKLVNIARSSSFPDENSPRYAPFLVAAGCAGHLRARRRPRLSNRPGSRFRRGTATANAPSCLRLHATTCENLPKASNSDIISSTEH